MNINTGEYNYYKYDKTENTFQYYKIEKEEKKTNIFIITTIILGLTTIASIAFTTINYKKRTLEQKQTKKENKNKNKQKNKK